MPTRMPKKAVKQEDYEDDFESGEDPETLIAKPMTKTKSGSKRQSRKSNRASAASPSTRHRAHSAPGSKSARDLWMNAVKTRSTSKLANGRPPESPRRKTPVEYWVDTLRKSRSGISTESTGMNTFSGLNKTNSKMMPYLSTSSYLRQEANKDRGGRREYDPSARSAAGTPAYKSPEEYYDEIIDLKKHVVALNHEVSTLRAKLRRTEENNIKKGKDIEQLLDPSKSEELRRTLGDRKPESGAVIHSLKQKILKLETQVRDKESSYSKLQGELKTTKHEEMKTQMDVLYQEIVRLHNIKDTGSERITRPSKESNVKMKALNETILRLNETNQRLMSENKTLKEDLQKALEDAAPAKSHRIREFEDMNKRELLTTLYGMKKKLDRAERNRDHLDADTISQQSLDSYRSGRPVSGKIKLEGTPEERLTQLDNRETELLKEIEKLKGIIKRLREDRSRNKSDAHSLTQRSPRPESSRGRHGGTTPRDRITTPRDRITTPRDRAPSPAIRKSRGSESTRSSRGDDQQRKVNNFREDRAAKSIQREWRAHRNRQDEQEEAKQFDWRIKHFLENRAATVIQREWRNHQDREFDGKVQKFTENRAARRIQNQWHGYQGRRDQNDATENIQAALRGHSARKRQMTRFRDYDDSNSTLTDDSYDDAMNTIQSSLRGHKARKERLRNTRYESTEDEEDLDGPRRRSVRPQSGKSSRSSPSFRHINELSGTRSSIFSSRKSPTLYDDEDDDDIVVG